MTRIAGQRQAQPSTVVHVDFDVLLQQAVENERWRVLRAVIEAVEAVPTRSPNKFDPWKSDPREADEVKRDVLEAIRRVEEDR